MKKIFTTREVLSFYVANPHLVGGFGEDVGKRLVAMNRF